MKELLLKIWDEESKKFTITYGNDPVGDKYIERLRNFIAEYGWAEDTTPSSVKIRVDRASSSQEDAERFVNRTLVWEFYQKVKEKVPSSHYPEARVVDRGYKWYKDYD